MFSFLSPSEKPVVEGLEKHEVTFAKNQSQYNPLRTVRGRTRAVPVLSRWALTDQQRQAISEGADIYLEVNTGGDQLQPIRMAIGSEVAPEYIAEQYGLELDPSDTIKK